MKTRGGRGLKFALSIDVEPCSEETSMGRRLHEQPYNPTSANVVPSPPHDLYGEIVNESVIAIAIAWSLSDQIGRMDAKQSS